MTTGDGLGAIAAALAAVGVAWAVAWSSVRLAAIRDEALRRLGEPTWTTKTTRRSA